MRTKKVIVAGHICVDMTPAFLPDFHGELLDIMLPGKLTQVGRITFSIGGAVANTGVCMKKLGADVSLMGKIGNDELGNMIAAEMEKHGASEGLIRSDDSATSYSIVLAPPSHDRTFLHSPGANDTFTFADLDFDAVKSADLFHFGYPPLMKSMYTDNGSQLVDLFKNVSEAGVVTSLDMAAIDPFSEVGKIDWKGICKSVLPYVDIFVPSIEELLYMMDKDLYFALNEEANGRDVTSILDLDRHVKPFAKKLIEMGAGIVLIKCGIAGMYYQTADADQLKKICDRFEVDADKLAAKKGFEESFLPDKVLSGVGAGDTAIGAFLTSLLRGYDIETCVRNATAEGASCVETYDALGGIRTLEQIEEKIAGGWEKQHILSCLK